MVYRYIYKITCTAGSFKDKFYFGQHTTENLDDCYFASGKKISDYIKKYGRENCIREIISFHNSDEDLNKAEYNIIHPWIGNEMCLNIKEGGYYGKPTSETIKKMSQSLKGRKAWNKGLKMTEEICQKNRESHLGQLPWNTGLNESGFSNKHHSEETKAKISSKLKNRKFSDETRKKISESLKGHKSWNKGLKKSNNKDEFSIAQTSNRNI